MSDYSKLTDKVNGRKIQVDSAIRDGQGNKIDTRYITSDGYYEQLGAGYADVADNLTPFGENSGLIKDECFTFQTSAGGSDVGSTSQLRELNGKTYVINQLIGSYYTDQTIANVSFSFDEDDLLTISGTANADGGRLNTITNNIILVSGHKYLFKYPSADQLQWVLSKDSDSSILIILSNFGENGCIYESTYSGEVIFGASVKNSVQYNTSGHIECIDLTKTFGVGKEPTSVIEFNRLFPIIYRPYEVGQVLSTTATKVLTTGFNAFDEEIELGAIGDNGALVTTDLAIRSKNYTRVVEGQTYTYYIHNSGSNIVSNYILCEYDIDKNFIKRNVAYSNKTHFELTANTSYIKLCFYTNDVTASLTGIKINLNLSWDGSRDGEYEPYVTHEYSLPNVELRSAGSVSDSILPNGTLTRRIGYVDLGTLNWSYNSNYGFICTERVSNMKYDAGTNFIPNLVCSRFDPQVYAKVVDRQELGLTDDKQISTSTDEYHFIVVNDDSYTDAVTFKTAMSGVYLYFELVEPTTEQVSSYTENIVIDNFGTQEIIETTMNMPVCSTWFYAVDYKAFIDSLVMREDIGLDSSEIVSHAELQEAVGDIDLSNYAKKEEAFNVINSSNITSSNLTDDLITVLTNDKPTRINGDLLGIHNPILFPNQNVGGSGNYYGFMIGWSATSGTYQGSFLPYVILTTASPKRIVLDTNPRLETYIKIFNGKTVPAYPSNTGTFVLKCVNGTLTWVAE